MSTKINREDILIRTSFNTTDINSIIELHGRLYEEEYNYGPGFKKYVAEGLAEFRSNFDPIKSRAWICTYQNKIIGCLFLECRGDAAQLRYYLIKPEFRGIGLGNKLMKLFLKFLNDHNYSSAYLWTTSELTAAAHLYKQYGFALKEEKKSFDFGKEVVEQRYDMIL